MLLYRHGNYRFKVCVKFQSTQCVLGSRAKWIYCKFPKCVEVKGKGNTEIYGLSNLLLMQLSVNYTEVHNRVKSL